MGNKEDIKNNGFKPLSEYRNALMGIAALSIYFFHAWIPITLEPQESSVICLSFLERFLKENGFLGVDIFFFLSGIGLTFAVEKVSLPRFYYRRIRRIILPFVTVGIIRGIVQNWGWSLIIRNITGFNFFTKDVNAFLWFVPAILTFYLFFPAYYKLFTKVQNKILFTAGVIMIWLLVSTIIKDTARGDLFGFTNRIPVFVIGILIATGTFQTVERLIDVLIARASGESLLDAFAGKGNAFRLSDYCLDNVYISYNPSMGSGDTVRTILVALVYGGLALFLAVWLSKKQDVRC